MNKVYGVDPLIIEQIMKEFDLKSEHEAAMTWHVLQVLTEYDEAGKADGLTVDTITTEVYKRMGLDEQGNLLQ